MLINKNAIHAKKRTNDKIAIPKYEKSIEQVQFKRNQKEHVKNCDWSKTCCLMVFRCFPPVWVYTFTVQHLE